MIYLCTKWLICTCHKANYNCFVQYVGHRMSQLTDLVMGKHRRPINISQITECENHSLSHKRQGPNLTHSASVSQQRHMSIVGAFYPKDTKKWMEQEALQGGPCSEWHSQRCFSSQLRAVVFNAPLLGNDQAQRANTRILLKDYCGFFRHANKRGVCIRFPHFPEYYVHVLEDETEDIAESFSLKTKQNKKSQKRTC